MPPKKKQAVEAETTSMDPIIDNSGELRTMSSNRDSRDKLNADVAAFLASGGKILEVERDIMADPPRKPVSNYGSRPI